MPVKRKTASKPSGEPPATSAAAARTSAAAAEILGENAGEAAVLGCMSIRFTGAELACPGQVLARLIHEAVDLAGDVGSVWVRAAWGPSGALEEVTLGRDLREKAGQTLLARVLDEFANMPKDRRHSRIVALVLSDGPRPEHARGVWTTGSRVAASFGIRISLGPVQDRLVPGGHIEIYVPLADLDVVARREAWVDFGRSAFEALCGSVGSFSPALWMEAIAPSALPLALFTRLPAVAVPRIVGAYAGGFNLPSFAPDRLGGLFEPPWIAWLSTELAARIVSYPGMRRTLAGGVELRVEEAAPLEMDDARYARYRDAWRSLDALRIRWSAPDPSDDHAPWRRALDRFDAPSFGELGAWLEREFANARKRSKLHHAISYSLREERWVDALREAEEAIVLGAGASGWALALEAAANLVVAGQLGRARATATVERALPFAETVPRIFLLAAKTHLALDERDAALAMLGAAPAAGDQAPDPLESEAVFAPVRDDERFRRAFGWAPRSLVERLVAEGASPDFAAYPKLAKALKKARAAFGRGASEHALAASEQALGIALPAPYRQMLTCFDGAVFLDGREVLHSAAELTRHNDANPRTLVIGRNLQLDLPGGGRVSEVHSGGRKARTPLSWKSLDACLSVLAKGDYGD